MIVLNSILAGIAIAIGGTAYLITGYAWLFPIGLFIVCFYNLDLFTGRICYISGKDSIFKYPVIYLLNTISAYLSGKVIAFCKPDLIEKALMLTQTKLGENFRLVPLAILCNVCIFVAVDSYKRTNGNPLGLIFATTVFVACGFEHCIANAFYFGIAGTFSTAMIWFLIANAGWNATGGIWIRYLMYLGESRWPKTEENNLKK